MSEIKNNEELKKNEDQTTHSEKKEEKKHSKKKKKSTDDIIQQLNEMPQEKLVNKYVELYSEYKKMKDQFDQKVSETDDMMDKYKRTLAEMENLRKRTLQEKQDSLKYANFNILSDLLVILDDFQRAIDSGKADKEMDLAHFLDGIDMIEKQFADLLFKKYGAQKFGEAGDPFDPQLHQAMLMEEGDYEEETVIEVFRNGYMLHDRVVRHAQVKVGKPEDK